jgi:hypothetical protein
LAEWFKFNPKINPLTLAALPSHPRTTWSKRWTLGGDPSPPADCAEVGASTRCSGPERQGMTPKLPFATAAANGRDGEGFRMPASGDLSARTGAGVRKPPRKEPAGAAWAVVAYGDLSGRRFG